MNLTSIISRFKAVATPHPDLSSVELKSADQTPAPSLEYTQWLADQLRAGDYCLRSRKSRKLSIIVSGNDQDGYIMLPINAQLTIHRDGKLYAGDVKAHVSQLVPELGATSVDYQIILPEISCTLPNVGIEAGDVIYLYETDDLDRYQVKSIEYLAPNLVRLEGVMA